MALFRTLVSAYHRCRTPVPIDAPELIRLMLLISMRVSYIIPANLRAIEKGG